MYSALHEYIWQRSMAICHAKLSHSKQLLKNIHQVMQAKFCSLRKKIFTVVTLKTSKKSPFTSYAQLQQQRRKT